MSELVSIITPTYNSEKYIAETIQSVQSQTYINWEMLIVDDFSSDKTIDIILKFINKDSRIRIIKLIENKGTGVARQKALDLANGKYIAFLDSDDIWKPEKLQKQIEFMKSKNLPFTFSFFDCIDDDSNFLGKRVQSPNPITYDQLFYCNFIGNLTGIYDVDFFGKIPIPIKRKRQDWMLWLVILKKIRLAEPVPESLALYRIRRDSLSTSKWRLLKHNYLVYRDFHKFSLVKSFFSMLVFLYVQFFIKAKYIKKL
ncbi:glycosyltransferase family 2 protein [Flavobacterium oreochromis]|uniref:Glycosyltransferase family 2 protein n=1 Tax=Flavobacterium oreochromis TaxID=2906078 RepID=A0ABW8P9I1_9FLAO|nr:glycosyltransferase family 2 protein [Flavobacterium oreochromis]OWP77265.1 glycosyl transferase [Flavobacterium oreochromis]POR28820.1 glycosyl transferase [Flavobacterium columnare]QYS87394.1 glycosyltransferase family 2 protein [Flavobacterium oreochromis]